MDIRARRVERIEGYSPSVALPRFSFLYLGAHGPHGFCVLTTLAFVPVCWVQFSTFDPDPPLPVYLGP